jgi:hypothetical protein
MSSYASLPSTGSSVQSRPSLRHLIASMDACHVIYTIVPLLVPSLVLFSREQTIFSAVWSSRLCLESELPSAYAAPATSQVDSQSAIVLQLAAEQQTLCGPFITEFFTVRRYVLLASLPSPVLRPDWGAQKSVDIPKLQSGCH